MRKNSYLNRVAPVFLAMILTACGSSGGGVPSTTTLGITSISPSTITTKPSLASNFIGTAVDFFSTREAVAQVTFDCANPADFAQSFDLSDGTIWVTQAYAVIDEVEFEDESSSSSDSNSSSDDSPDNRVSVVDLTGTDGNVPDSIPLNVPTGKSYTEIKFKVKRLEDNPSEQPVNVSGEDLAAFLKKVGFKDNANVRPSIFIEGSMALTADLAGTCKAFKFSTDRRSSVRVPLRDGEFDIDSEEAVLQFDIEAAFKAAELKTATVTVANLSAEIGVPSLDKPLGAGFLDGRLKNPAKFGSTNARLVATELAVSVEMFTQPIGTFSASGSRIDDSKDDHISGSVPGRVDDNPSASDLDAPPV